MAVQRDALGEKMGCIQMTKQKKGFTILGEEGVKVIMVIVISLALIYLGVKMFGLYATTTAIEKAKSELVGIETGLNEADIQKAEKEYIVLHTPDWYLFSSELKNDLCNGNFCLCLCKSKNCGGDERACVPTSRFVMLEKDGEPVRILKIEGKPKKIILEMVNVDAYPYTYTEISEQGGWAISEESAPFFMKFTTATANWEWSYNLEYWKSAAAPLSSDDKSKLSQENQEFITNDLGMHSTSKEEMEKIFFENGAELSRGVYVVKA